VISTRGYCWRPRKLMLLVNSHILKMATMLKSSAEYNRRLHWAFSNGNNSILWISEINHLWRCGKIYGFRTVQRRLYASEEESLERTHREDSCNHWKGSNADFRWRLPRAIVAKINFDCWYKRVNNVSNYRGGPSLQIVKDTTDAPWSCQEQAELLPFWSPNNPDLNPLDYYVWSIIKSRTSIGIPVSLRTVIEAAFISMDNATLQHANASDRE